MAHDDLNDLSMRELILGKLRGLDYEGTGKVHTSDFQHAVEQLGLRYSDDSVSDILIQCDITNDGFVDFSNMVNWLATERSIVARQVERDFKESQLKSFGQSSSEAKKDGIFEGDESHHQQAQSNYNRRLMQKYRQAVHEAYQKFIDGHIDEIQFIDTISNCGITPTVSLKTALRKNRRDITYTEVHQCITQIDSFDLASEKLKTERQMQEKKEKMTSGRRHYFYKKEENSDLFSQEIPHHFFNAKKEHVSRTLNSKGMGDAMTYKKHAAGRSQVSFMTNNRAVDHYAEIAALTDESAEDIFQHSTRHGHLQPGKTTIANYNPTDTKINYTSEQRLLREQTLQCLRQVCSGTMGGTEFVDRLYSLGILLPSSLVALVCAPTVDFKNCVRELDALVFVKRALEEKVSPARIAEAKVNLIRGLKRDGYSDFLAKLTSIFKQMDVDGNQELSFSEFRRGCRLFGVPSESQKGGVSDEDLKILFTEFDSDGNGSLSYSEFTDAIMGEINNKRRNIISSAFRKIDMYGEGTISIDDFVAAYNPASHPDVVNNTRSSLELIRHLVSFFEENDFDTNEQNSISEETFTQYFLALSPTYLNDDDFVSMMKNSFALSELTPVLRSKKNPFKIRKGGVAGVIPLVQTNPAISHGNIVNWTTDVSEIEEMDMQLEKKERSSRFNSGNHRDGLGHHERTIDLFRWANEAKTRNLTERQKEQEKYLKDHSARGVPDDEWVAAGALKIRRVPEHSTVKGSNNLLRWPGASGQKENKEEVAAEIQQAREDEESRMFPKGPKTDSGGMLSIKRVAIKTSGNTDDQYSLSTNLMRQASNENNNSSNQKLTINVNQAPTKESAKALGEKIALRLRSDEKQRQRLYHSAVPFGKDTDTNSGDAVHVAPASACGPAMGAETEHPSLKYQGFGKPDGPVRFTRTGRVLMSTREGVKQETGQVAAVKIKTLGDLIDFKLKERR